MGDIPKIRKRKCKVLSDPIFKAEVFFLLGGTPEELRKYFIDLHGWSPEFDETTAGLQHKVIVKETLNNRFYLWLDRAEMGNLVHETAHLAWDVMRTMGIEPDEKTEEIYCYLQEYYFREIYTASQEMRQRKKA